MKPAVQPDQPTPLPWPDDPPDETGGRLLAAYQQALDAVEPPEILPGEEVPETLARPGPLTARTLRIVTKPPGARVYRDSELLEGVTPLEAVLEPSTDYSLRIERDGYLPSGVSISRCVRGRSSGSSVRTGRARRPRSR